MFSPASQPRGQVELNLNGDLWGTVRTRPELFQLRGKEVGFLFTHVPSWRAKGCFQEHVLPSSPSSPVHWLIEAQSQGQHSAFGCLQTVEVESQGPRAGHQQLFFLDSVTHIYF